MALSFSPEFQQAIAPMAEAMASAPKLPAGDVDSRRKAVGGLFAALLDSMPAVPNVSQTIHHATAKDGHQVEIYHLYKKDQSSSAGKPTSAILHIHGGGMILGSVPMFLKAIAALVDISNVPFFSVEYRLAPENPHPTPVEDCYAGLTWLHEHASELNVDPARIGVMGESAGGGLSAAVALLARDRKLSPPLAKQILVYPMLDDRNTTPDPNIEPFAVWKYDDNVTGWGALIGDKAGKDGVEPYAAPARAESLAGLPSTFIDVGFLDIFRDEDLVYAQRLAKAGVSTEFHLYPGVPHGFEGFMPNGETTKAAMGNRVRAILSI